MPVIVVGADTAPGRAVVDALADPRREIRVFVSDQDDAAAYRDHGVKVAFGDVSDESHIEAASGMCFTAVLVTEAAVDGRERSFAEDAPGVLEMWARAVANARVRRVIWITDAEPPPTDAPEVVTVSLRDSDLAARVAALDAAQRIL